MPVTGYSLPAVVIEQLRFLANRRVIRSMLGFGRSALSVYLYFPARFTSCFSYIYSARGRIEGHGDSISQKNSRA